MYLTSGASCTCILSSHLSGNYFCYWNFVHKTAAAAVVDSCSNTHARCRGPSWKSPGCTHTQTCKLPVSRTSSAFHCCTPTFICCAHSTGSSRIRYIFHSLSVDIWRGMVSHKAFRNLCSWCEFGVKIMRLSFCCAFWYFLSKYFIMKSDVVLCILKQFESTLCYKVSTKLCDFFCHVSLGENLLILGEKVFNKRAPA